MSTPSANGRSQQVTPQAVARRWMHDLVCMSDWCRDERADEHAARTQGPFARAVVRALKNGERLGPVIHEHSCLGCDHPAEHARNLNNLGAGLALKLDAAC